MICDTRLLFGGRPPANRLVAIGTRVAVLADLLLCPLARKSLFHAALLSWFQVERVPLHFLDDVLGLDLAFEPAQRVF